MAIKVSGIVILNVYNLPSNLVDNSILQFITNFRYVIICGDFNAHLPSKLHSYPTRFATGENYATARFNKSNLLRSIPYLGPVFWNELPPKIKNFARINPNNFVKHVKKFLHLNQK